MSKWSANLQQKSQWSRSPVIKNFTAIWHQRLVIGGDSYSVIDYDYLLAFSANE